MKKEDINLSDILQNVADDSPKSEHLLSNMELEDLVSLASTNDNTLKVFSQKEEIFKLSSQDGWIEGDISSDGWQSYTTSDQEDSVTLLLKGVNIEFIN